MKRELIEQFYEELKELMLKYDIETISGITIGNDNEPDVMGATFDTGKEEMMKDISIKIAQLFKPHYDVEQIISGSTKG
jgi:hypothetical protein